MAGVAQRRRQGFLERAQRFGREPEGKCTIGAERDDAFVPAVGLSDCLVDGKGVKELIRNDERRALWNFGERAVPMYRCGDAGERLALAALQHRARFDEMRGEGAVECG